MLSSEILQKKSSVKFLVFKNTFNSSYCSPEDVDFALLRQQFSLLVSWTFCCFPCFTAGAQTIKSAEHQGSKQIWKKYLWHYNANTRKRYWTPVQCVVCTVRYIVWLVPYPYQLLLWIRIQTGKNDIKKWRNFVFLSAGNSHLRAEGFSYVDWTSFLEA